MLKIAPYFVASACVLAMQQGYSRLSASDNTASATDPMWSRPSSVLNLKALPLGNNKYTTTAPRKGYVYACDADMYQFPSIIGARVTGPWVNEAEQTFDATAKIYTRGSVFHDGRLSITESGNLRVFVGNGLPVGIPTGVYPIADSDPAIQYDANPNAITEQPIAFSIPLNPTVAVSPFCTYKRIGITLDGVELDTPLDSSGRDENGYELNDACGGKPQPGGSYHRQFLSECIPHIRDHNALVGYALDGFGIFSSFDENGKELVSADLDECHGITSQIDWDGQRKIMYHYVMTRDFPYTLTCFRGKPNYEAFPPLPPPPHLFGRPAP
jgi:hypothetical protein